MMPGQEGHPAVARRFPTVDRSVVDHAIMRLREGLAQALPFKPKAGTTRLRACPHCQKDVDAGVSKCPYCRRLFKI